MGAEGVNLGTRFMATVEAPIHDNIKQALVDADERDTTHVMRSVKNTERVFKNGERNLGHNLPDALRKQCFPTELPSSNLRLGGSSLFFLLGRLLTPIELCCRNFSQGYGD